MELRARPFAIHVEDAVLADLRVRLADTRWPDQVQDAGWEQGTERETLRSLVAHWADGFDWRAYERDLNELPQFKADVRGLGIHYVHQRAARGPGLPILLVNGWPSTFVEELPLVPLLTDPQAHGIAGPAFDVVIPSLPGYGFSDRSPRAGVTPRATAELFVELMRGLGYERFVAHGSDFGAEVLTQLALLLPAAPRRPSPLDVRLAPVISARVPDALSGRARVPRRTRGLGRRRVRVRRAQSTKPQSLGYALNDSPSGWRDGCWKSGVRGATAAVSDRALGREFLLAMLTIYWVTVPPRPRPAFTTTTAATSCRWDRATTSTCPPPSRSSTTTSSTKACHRASGRQRLFNVYRWTDIPRGGHFAATEEPVLLATDIAAF